VTKTMSLESIATITMGTSPKGTSYNEQGQGLPLLNGPTEFGHSHPDCTLFTTESKKQCERGDLIFCVRGSTTGRMNWADKVYSLGRGVCSIRGATELDTRYLKHCLTDRLSELLVRAGGATMPNLTQDTIRSFKIPFPECRRKIASILSAYDDLIENNTRRIAILEEMAQVVYREWFVNFKFPGHENAKFVESELGKIPEGWEIRTLDEVADITMGTSPKSSTYNDHGEGTPLVNGPVEFGDKFTQRVKWTTDPKRFCDAGDLVVCVRGSTTGKYVKSDGVYCLGRGVCGIRGKHQSFVDHLFTDQLPSLLAKTGGSTFPSWTGPQLNSHRVLSPPTALVARFDDMIAPKQRAVFAFTRKNTNLRATRDLLLPKLISGQLNIEKLDIDTGVIEEELLEASA